ncbi:MAG: C-terminal binding protein [Planctomycetota bacterium]|jgi:D-3-phosphoglycerate dehydrogenase
MADIFKVVVTDYIEPNLNWEEEEMEKRGNVEFVHHQLKFCPEEEVVEAVKDADVIVVNMVKMPESVINKLEKCKLIIRHGAGYDNVDAAACTAKGIPLSYVPDYCMDEVAEQAIALMFALARQVPQSRQILDDSVKNEKWDFTPLAKCYRMAGKVLGIVGCGRIGGKAYEKMRHFGWKEILVCDPYLSDEKIKELGITIVPREKVFKEADFITVHTPLADETKHIVNKETLSMMKPTAYLVNTSRGPMVDTDALAEALKNKSIAGAGIDVYDKEPPEKDYPLFDLENAILTPHLAWYSEDAAWDIRYKIVEDIDLAIAGKNPRFCVNKEVLK